MRDCSYKNCSGVFFLAHIFIRAQVSRGEDRSLRHWLAQASSAASRSTGRSRQPRMTGSRAGVRWPSPSCAVSASSFAHFTRSARIFAAAPLWPRLRKTALRFQEVMMRFASEASCERFVTKPSMPWSMAE